MLFLGSDLECYYFCSIFNDASYKLKNIEQMDLRTILTLLFYVVLLGVAFWVGSLLERNERKYKKYFKED